MDKGLNVKEKAILKYIEKEINKKGYAPTIREICEETGIKSTASVYNYMVSLKKKGYIEYDTKRCRTLKILKENEDKLSELETYKKIAEKLAEELEKCTVENKEWYLEWAKREVLKNEQYR